MKLTARIPPGGDRGGAERGSVTVFVVFFTLVALALASLLVDVGNAVNAQERAADLAEQAARAAANAIDVADLRSGTVTIDQTRACADALNLIQAYAAASRARCRHDRPVHLPGPETGHRLCLRHHHPAHQHFLRQLHHAGARDSLRRVRRHPGGGVLMALPGRLEAAGHHAAGRAVTSWRAPAPCSSCWSC